MNSIINSRCDHYFQVFLTSIVSYRLICSLKRIKNLMFATQVASSSSSCNMYFIWPYDLFGAIFPRLLFAVRFTFTHRKQFSIIQRWKFFNSILQTIFKPFSLPVNNNSKPRANWWFLCTRQWVLFSFEFFPTRVRKKIEHDCRFERKRGLFYSTLKIGNIFTSNIDRKHRGHREVVGTTR